MCVLYSFLYLFSIEKSLGADENLMQSEIKHLVILMMENRSFDNVLGWLYSNDDAPTYFIPEDADPKFRGLSQINLEDYTNELRDSQGNLVFSSPPIKGIPSVLDGELINSPTFNPHEDFDHVTSQVFNGTAQAEMKGFLQDYASLWDEKDWVEQKKEICGVMESYTENEMPLLNGLAKHYAVSDDYFSSVPTQTNPNRAFCFCGTSEGQVVNGTLGKSIFLSDTIWNRLSEESPETSWTIFWQADLVPFIFKGPLSGTHLFPAFFKIANLDEHFKRFNVFHELARKGQLPDISFLEPQWTLTLNLSPKDEEDLHGALQHQETLFGFQGNDLHPPGDVRSAEDLIANIYTSLTSNKSAWNKTLFVIVFDEHGGLFDHIKPPKSISPDQHNQNGFNFDRYGVRVPAIFISSRIKERTLIRSENSEIPFDHTSIIATILKWKNIDQSRWRLGARVQQAPTFESVITLKIPREDKVISLFEKEELNRHEDEVAVCLSDKFYIKDEKGNYLFKSPKFYRHFAHVGPKEDRIAYQFAGGAGSLTVGSFVLIRCCDNSLKEKNLLQSALFSYDCIFGKNTSDPKQWWTVKCKDNFCVGSKIYYGDKVFLENHIYIDTIQYVPSRLMKTKGLLGTFLKTCPISDALAEDQYWILEKA